MFYWDPPTEIFTIPFLGIPIQWYGALFALGFYIGFWIASKSIKRFLLRDPEYTESDILHVEALKKWGGDKKKITQSLNSEIQKEGIKKIPVEIQSTLKRFRPQNFEQAAHRLIFDKKLGRAVLGILKKGDEISDRALLYLIIATVTGARIGHFVFYENPRDYLQDPLQILRIWEGGLASHGGFIAIFIGFYIFSSRLKKKVKRLSMVNFLDLISAPVALTGCFIRVGNFVNQEILGTPTTLPWGVLFGHPSGGPKGIPLHPVQLYEALFYLLTFLTLYLMNRSDKILFNEGKISGVFLTAIFGFRFLVEFVKFEQSHFFSSSLNMGQILSIPPIFIGVFFLFSSKLKSKPN